MAAIPKGSTVVTVGTEKGLFVFHSRDRKRWKLAGRHFDGVPVHDAMYDPEEGLAFAAVNSSHWGPLVHRSRTLSTWTRGKAGPAYAKDTGWSVKRIWQVEAGGPSQPGILYAGVEPAGLFRSKDDGDSWELVTGLTDHASRKDWQPGGGGLCLHTILPHPDRAGEMLVAISAVGVFRTDDGGEKWRPMNQGMRAPWFPKEQPELGYCPHKLARDEEDPDVLYQQHHGGVFRWDPRRGRWVDVSRGLPSKFGFPMAAGGDGTAFVVPMHGDFDRTTLGEMAVYRTRDGGRRWQRLTNGLPKPAHLTVLREGLATDSQDPLGVYVATENGQLFASRDGGDHWTAIAEHLPLAMSVTASTYP